MKEPSAFPRLCLIFCAILWLMLNAAMSQNVKLRLDDNDYLQSNFFTGPNNALFMAGIKNSAGRTLDTLLREPHVSVKDYGATGDGVTNDDTAMQAAVAAAKAAAKPLYIPAGTYLITSPLVLDWDGARVIGAGGSYYDGGTTLLVNTDAAAISVTTDSEGVTIANLRVKGPGQATSTKAGIHFVLASGTNVDNALVQGVHVRDFDFGIRADDVANSVFLACDLSHNDIGFSSAGNSNSNTLLGVSAMECTTSSIKISGGAPWTVIGGDVGGSGNAKPLDITSTAATLQGVNLEAHAASSGTLVDIGTNSKVAIVSCYFNWLGGGATRPFAVTQASGSSLSVVGGAWGVSDSTTSSQVKHVSTISTTTQSVGVTLYVQQYNAGVAQTRFLSSVLLGQTGNDGIAADATTMGMFRVRHTTPTELQFFYKTAAGGYGIANVLQYALDTTAGVAPKTNVANSWSADQTIGGSYRLIFGTSAGALGGAVAWSGETGNQRRYMMRGYEYADADWALRIGTAAATDPTIPRIYHDGLNNRTTIGHNAASQPAVGSAKLNIGDLGTLLLNPQASAPTGAKGMIYCNTNGNFYGHNGTAWVQLNN